MVEQLSGVMVFELLPKNKMSDKLTDTRNDNARDTASV